MDDPFLSGGGTDEELEAELAAELAALGEITEDEVQAAQQGLLEHPFAWIPEEEPAEVPRSAPQQSDARKAMQDLASLINGADGEDASNADDFTQSDMWSKYMSRHEQKDKERKDFTDAIQEGQEIAAQVSASRAHTASEVTTATSEELKDEEVGERKLALMRAKQEHEARLKKEDEERAAARERLRKEREEERKKHEEALERLRKEQEEEGRRLQARMAEERRVWEELQAVEEARREAARKEMEEEERRREQRRREEEAALERLKEVRASMRREEERSEQERAERRSEGNQALERRREEQRIEAGREKERERNRQEKERREAAARLQAVQDRKSVV